jgi:cyanosortase A-associated protein
MKFPYWLNNRRLFLGGVTIGIIACILRVSLQPLAADPVSRLRAGNSPPRINRLLSDWQLSEQVPIPVEPKQSRYDQIIGGQRYIYYQGTQKLTVDLRDIQDASGDIGLLQDKYLEDKYLVSTPLNRQQVQTHNIKAGTYQSFIENGKTSIHTCVIANGRFSTTANEFRHNTYRQTLDLQQWSGWLFGRHALIENRCFWVQMTLDDTSNRPKDQLDKLFSNLLQDFVAQIR